MTNMTASVQINKDTIKKLTHSCEEIRQRTLEQINAKVIRCLAHDETIDFNSGELCKQLIRWFGFDPIQQPTRVLELILRILQSKYGEKAVGYLRVDRFLREIGKVAVLMRSNHKELNIVSDIQNVLNRYRKPQEDIIEILDTLSLENIGDHADETGDITPTNQVSATSSRNSKISIEEFEEPWSKPTIADYNAMKLVAEILINPLSNEDELENALQHLQITIIDYPPEYILQSPNIYLNLIDLYDRADEINCSLNDVTLALLVYLRNLQSYLHVRNKTVAYRNPYNKNDITPKTQLKLEKALELLLEKSLKQLQILLLDARNEISMILEIIHEALKIYKFKGFYVNEPIIHRLCIIIANLKETYEQNETITIQRIKYLLMVFILQDVVKDYSRNKRLTNDIEIMEPLLMDYTLQVNFPNRYAMLKDLLIETDKKQLHKYETLQKYEKQISMAIDILKSPKNFDAITIIKNGSHLCFPLDKLKSFKLTECVLETILSNRANYVGNEELRNNASDLLLKMLRLSYEPLKAIVYEKITVCVKKFFVFLMSGESICTVLPNHKLLESLILGIPWTTSLIMQFITDFHSTNSGHIKQNIEDTIVILLKGKHLLGKFWSNFVTLLLPVMPLMQCCVNSTRITAMLVQHFDPDCKTLSFLPILQGNCCYLFHPDSEIRNEALTRIMFMLNTLPSAPEYVPNIMEVSDLIPNDLCLLKAPRKFSRIFSTSMADYEKAVLNNLLLILDSPDIEPIVRKTTLMQINVMCQNWQILESFTSEGASYLILKSIENSLTKCSKTDYIDNVVPAVSILCKVLFYDYDLRQELVQTPNIFILLLRSLFVYPNDLQIREDASLCLFLLIYSNFLIVVPNSTNGIEAPSILSNLQLPMHCEFKQSLTINNECDEFEKIFATSEEQIIYLRHFIASCFCNGAAKVTQKYLDTQLEEDICKELRLTHNDWRLLKATRPTQNLRRFLTAVENATEHKTLINTLIMLKIQIMLMATDTSRDIPEDIACNLFKMLAKYLQLPPGNELDYILFEHMVELCDLCIRIPLPSVIINLTKTLQGDYHHACIVLLKSLKTPLGLFYKICQLLTNLLKSPYSNRSLLATKSNATVFYSNFFDLLFEVINNFFDHRELQRVRCLLSMTRIISNFNMCIPDKLLNFYCKRFLHLSIQLKSSTQTGAQWQRDCLQLICQLYNQMETPIQSFNFNGTAKKYLSGLGGHNDGQVRALAWCILTKCARRKENNRLVGIEELTKELSYLPGGFAACCLCTLFDTGETVLVRQLAGNLFVEFFADSKDGEMARNLLESQDFFKTLNESLNNCILTENLEDIEKLDSQSTFSTCELISTYCKICIKITEIDATFFKELCEKSFMFKVYELLKLPPAYKNPSYYTMCADICQLYALCYPDYFKFLQHTLCRDNVWLSSFTQLLQQNNSIESELVNVLNLLMVLCKDITAYERLCEKFASDPAPIINIFVSALKVTHINRALQTCTLAVMSLLLIKSQYQSEGDYKSFLDVLESCIEIEQASITENSKMEKDKENKKNLANVPSRQMIIKSKCELPPTRRSGSVLIFMELYGLFNHLCPMKSCKFDTEPCRSKVQITETLSLLLKLSPEAQEAAKNFKLFDKIIRIFKLFFEEFTTPCVTFIRRYGETKKIAIINNFLLYLNMLLNWFSAPTVILTDELQIEEFTKVLLKLWSWLSHSADLKLLVLKVCAFMSEYSLAVCEQFSTIISTYGHSILQLVIKIATFETTTVKASSSETFPVISVALRVITNCCACAEGRILTLKSRTLDIFDGLHPFNLKSPRIKLDILHSWLQFWELFSRYNEGGNARNLNALCEVINRSSAHCGTRLLSLRILRNMCFLTTNRPTLLASDDFIYTINQIVSQPMNDSDTNTSYEEQFLVSVAVWKLISGGVKFITMIRGTKLAKQFNILRDHLLTMENENPKKLSEIPYAGDLRNVLDVIFSIFKT